MIFQELFFFQLKKNARYWLGSDTSKLGTTIHHFADFYGATSFGVFIEVEWMKIEKSEMWKKISNFCFSNTEIRKGYMEIQKKKNQLRIFWAQKNLFHSFLNAFRVPLKFNIDKLLRDFFLLFIHIIHSCLANHSVCRCTLGKNPTVLIQPSAILIYNSIRLIQFSNSAI